MAVSGDDAETAKRFKASLKAPYSFVADERATLVKAYDVKMFLLPAANRVTFVVGPGLKVLAREDGGDALDPSGAVKACSLKPPRALEYLVPDAGAR
jgi:peroxiredoxin Q/BCP